MISHALPSPGAELRKLMKSGIVILPGVYDAITAQAARSAGARGLYLTGAGVTNARLGVPDIAMITQSEMAQVARQVCQIANLPVIADADTGYGEVWNVVRTVIDFEAAGLAGLHLEDQLSPKRCGHLDGKQVISAERHAQKVRAAVEAKRDPQFLIVARTDARSVEGIDGALDRAKCYVDAGADAIFPEGLVSETEFEAFRKAVSVPLMANMTEFGKTPLITAARFGELGYEIVIFPMSAFRMMLKAVSECYEELLKTGTQARLLDRMKTRAELYELIGYREYEQKDVTWSKELG